MELDEEDFLGEFCQKFQNFLDFRSDFKIFQTLTVMIKMRISINPVIFMQICFHILNSFQKKPTNGGHGLK